MSADRDVGRRTAERTIRLAIDVGGTFTDLAILDEAERSVSFDKTSTTLADPAIGVIEGFAKAGVALSDVSYFIHGTTLALNALLTRTGAPLALVTTLGFRDVHELARTDREVMYDLKYRKPASLVPRRLVFEVRERISFEGQTLVPFDRAGAEQVADEIGVSGVQAVAVCFLHSYANPDHELLMEEVLRTRCPGLDITLSHRLVREYREYERTSTAVIDAYIKPIVRRYLDHLRGALAAADFRGRFLVTRSGGGAMTVETAVEQPAHLVLSGPAAGVIGAAAFAATVNEPYLITIDMGGTSLDASLIVNGAPTTSGESSFEGQAISLPALNIKTIGAGGGSIAWIDEAGLMQVGPQSAAAVPGPASYGRGGSRATVTDAALLVGLLGEKTALGGELTLVRELAEKAVGEIAGVLGVALMAVADGIIRIVGTHVTGAVREITVEQGHDPADFALLAYGGGGGMIAGDVARELGIPRVIVPPGPGAFSAFGMLLTDVIHDFAQTRVAELGRADPGELTALFAELEERGSEALERDGFGPEASELLRSAELRFAGQEHTVAVPVAAGELTAQGLVELAETFAGMHQDRYGHRMSDPVELVTARLRAVGRVPRPELPLAGSGDVERAHIGQRQVYLGNGRSMAYEVYRRERLGRGCVIAGPAIVEELTATTVVHRGDALTVGDHGELTIAIGPGEARQGGLAGSAGAATGAGR